jgi:hypothetical protein
VLLIGWRYTTTPSFFGIGGERPMPASNAPIPRFVSAVLLLHVDGYERRIGPWARPVHDGRAAALMLEPDLGEFAPGVAGR